MRIEQVKKMKPLDRFLYWVKERHAICEKRMSGLEKPWTDDVILQRYFFTNPYRENDKTTVWFRENIRDPLRNDAGVLFATVAFRWFNLHTTGVLLMNSGIPPYGLLEDWNEKTAVKLLTRAWQDGKNPVFTGAYMIKAGNGPRGCKIPNVCRAISTVWEERERLVKVCEQNSMQNLTQELKKFTHLGGFMSYEIACDLRYTALLENAVDKDTWCNPGPGARRGMNRLLGVKNLLTVVPRDVWQRETQDLLTVMRSRLKSMPHFEMREVEHSLCEYFKYEKILYGQGNSKRRYNGV